MFLQIQLRKRRRKPTYDDDDEEDDDLNSGKSQKSGRKGIEESVWSRARVLVQPTADWGPVSRNHLTPSRTFVSPSGDYFNGIFRTS